MRLRLIRSCAAPVAAGGWAVLALVAGTLSSTAAERTLTLVFADRSETVVIDDGPLVAARLDFPDGETGLVAAAEAALVAALRASPQTGAMPPVLVTADVVGAGAAAAGQAYRRARSVRAFLSGIAKLVSDDRVVVSALSGAPDATEGRVRIFRLVSPASPAAGAAAKPLAALASDSTFLGPVTATWNGAAASTAPVSGHPSDAPSAGAGGAERAQTGSGTDGRTPSGPDRPARPRPDADPDGPEPATPVEPAAMPAPPAPPEPAIDTGPAPVPVRPMVAEPAAPVGTTDPRLAAPAGVAAVKPRPRPLAGLPPSAAPVASPVPARRPPADVAVRVPDPVGPVSVIVPRVRAPEGVSAGRVPSGSDRCEPPEVALDDFYPGGPFVPCPE